MLRLGLLGAGTIADIHTGSLKSIPEARVTRIHAASESDRTSLAAKRGAVAVDDPQEVIGADDVDAVLVCTPTESHADYTVAALEAGKHVFCEKPMALRLDDADRMIAASERSGKVLMVGLVLRWFHEFRKIHDLVTGGTVGTVKIARTTRAAGFPRGRDDWYADHDRSGGLAMDMITHDYDFLRWCFGEVDRVMARGLAPRGLDHLDYCLVLLRFRSGVIAHVEGSWAHPAGTFFTRADLAGTEGSISFDSRKAVPFTMSRHQTSTGGGSGVAVPESPVEASPYLQEMRHFLSACRGEAPLQVTAQDGRAALRIALAVNESIRTGQPVSLTEEG
jgi:predicted dehydrogenase